MSDPIKVLGGWQKIRANIAEIRKSPRFATEEEVAAVCDLAIEWLNEPFDGENPRPEPDWEAARW